MPPAGAVQSVQRVNIKRGVVLYMGVCGEQGRLVR